MKSKKILISLLFLILIFIGIRVFWIKDSNSHRDENTEIKAKDLASLENRGEIYLAGGCFWGVEGYFKKIPGVIDTSVGYANGKTDDTTYDKIGKTDHSEVDKIN